MKYLTIAVLMGVSLITSAEQRCGRTECEKEVDQLLNCIANQCYPGAGYVDTGYVSVKCVKGCFKNINYVFHDRDKVNIYGCPKGEK